MSCWDETGEEKSATVSATKLINPELHKLRTQERSMTEIMVHEGTACEDHVIGGNTWQRLPHNDLISTHIRGRRTGG
jgi:hypothetical protein